MDRWSYIVGVSTSDYNDPDVMVQVFPEQDVGDRMKVKICLPDNRIVMIDGERYGCVTVAPLLRADGKTPATVVWGVRSFDTGMRAASYTSLKVARNFAQYLDREFGDVLPKAFTNSYHSREDESDKALLDFIDERADHPARWWNHRQQMKFRKTG